MVRKFRVNNTLKGRVEQELKLDVKRGSITFKRGDHRNVWVVEVDESKMRKMDVHYMNEVLLPKNREIKQ